MKLLQLTKKFPFPLHDGESVAVNSLAKGLSESGWTVDLLSMNTSKHHFDYKKHPEALSYYRNIFLQDINNNVSYWGALKHLLKRQSYQATRFQCQAFEEKLIQVLKTKDYDIVQLESVYLAFYIPTIRKYSTAKIAMRSHNVEHLIWKRLAAHTSNPLKKWYFNRISNELANFEAKYLNQTDFLLPISEKDYEKFKLMGLQIPAHVVPIGMNIVQNKPIDQQLSNKLAFIGTLDWWPNIQGLRWFMEEIWQKSDISKSWEMHIAGKGADSKLKTFIGGFKSCFFHGKVNCVHQYLSDFQIMIVPLLSGSGMRVKILEGMARGMLVITTAQGLEGIPAKHKEQVLIANNKIEFEEALKFVVDHKEAVQIVRKEAINFIESQFGYQQLATELHEFYVKHHQKLEKESSVAVN